MNSEQTEELSSRVDEVLYYKWDPIGVSDEPEARGEYESYVPKLTSLVLEANEAAVAFELTKIIVERMGISSNDAHNREIAKLLIRCRYAIEEGLR